MRRLFVNCKSFIEKYASGRTTLILLIITLGVYGYMLQYSIPAVMEYADGMKLFDMRPLGYDIEYARLLLDNLGDKGRETYLHFQIPIDMVYPLLFAVGYSFLLAYLFRSAFKPENRIHWLIFIPVLAGLFDYLENIGIIVMLTSYPDLTSELVGITCAFSVTKAFATTIFWLLLIISVVAAVIKKFHRA